MSKASVSWLLRVPSLKGWWNWAQSYRASGRIQSQGLGL